MIKMKFSKALLSFLLPSKSSIVPSVLRFLGLRGPKNSPCYSIFNYVEAANVILLRSPEIYKEFFLSESKEFFDSKTDYIIDCIDTVSSKIELVLRTNEAKVPIISCMGTGNKLNPTKFEIDDTPRG